MPQHVALLARTRGSAPLDAVERVHYGSVVVVDRHGAIIASAGDAEALNFTRSTLKPLQALPFVEDDGLARLGFGSQELAMMCASHSGEAIHLRLVQSMLERAGASAADLQCGCHPPRYFAATATPVPAGLAPTPLTHNCSGKHAGFLAYCRMHGHDRRSYLDPQSPLQTRIRNTVQRFAPGEALASGIDGCSAPNFALPLRRLAQAYGAIASGEAPELRALFYAMTRHPDLVSGTARTDLALMRTGGGDWVSKIGADGLQAIGVRSLSLGIAIRVADGDPDAVHALTADVLHQLGLLDDPAATPLAARFRPPLRNARGTITGHTRALFSLPRVVAGAR